MNSLRYIFFLVICIVSKGECATIKGYDISYHLNNDTHAPLYVPLIYIDGSLFWDSPFAAAPKSTSGYATYGQEKLPATITIKWKRAPAYPSIARTINISGYIDIGERGDIYVSVTEGEELKLSWIKRDEKFVALDCGGYIFEEYISKARPQYEKRIKKLAAYNRSKVEAKETGRFSDFQLNPALETKTEGFYRCNPYFYLGFPGEEN